MSEALNEDDTFRLDTEFSRDQQGKLSVHDRMLRNAPQFWAWLNNGAYIHVCERRLREEKRYQRDIY
jgi:sulfite reductase alpha subunit-like flavoprotein